MHRTLIVAGSLWLAAARFGLSAEAVDASNRVREFVEPYLRNKQIPGCAIMVRYNGKVALCAGYGIANLVYVVPTQTLFAELTPLGMMGRVVAFRGSLVFGALTLAMAISGLMAEVIPAGTVIAIFGFVTLGAGVVAAFLPAIRRS